MFKVFYFIPLSSKVILKIFTFLKVFNLAINDLMSFDVQLLSFKFMFKLTNLSSTDKFVIKTDS